MLPSLAYTNNHIVKNTIIIGWNIGAARFYDTILDNPALGYHIRGFINPIRYNEKCHYKNVPVLGSLNVLKDVVERLDISHALVYLSDNELQFLNSVKKVCAEANVQFLNVQNSKKTVSAYTIKNMISNKIDYSIRRLIEFVISIFILCLILPLYILITFIIKIESSGPSLVFLKRYGKGGVIYSEYRFRIFKTDYIDRNSNEINSFKLTKIGEFLQQTKLECLPFIFNIIKGDISIIGPKPEYPFITNSYKDRIPYYLNRYKVKPGIFGLAQVSTIFDDTIEDIEEILKKDMEYIDNRNKLIFNINILIKSILMICKS